ncbi:MAG TPA: MCE family protein [Acidimicrobiales bacterium]|nr:MCE family protein [Acidimicrobiales bacterium]
MTRTAIKFGLFVALCLLFTVYLASTIGNTTIGGLVGRGEPTYTLTASFEDATGLLVNDNVKVAGVAVGKVTGIDVESGQAVVTMELDEDRKLPTDSSAAVRWRNLIGQRYVYLYPGEAPTALEDGDVIDKTTNVIDIGELFNRLGPIVAAIDEGKVNEFLGSVTKALEGNAADVSKAIDDLAVVAKGLGERDQAIAGLIDNLEVVSRTIADRDTQIETMLDNLAALARTFSDNTALIDQAVTEMGAFNRDFSGILEANRGEIDRIIARLANTLGTVQGELPAVETALDQLDDNGSAAFLAASNGEFLNQAILCLAVSPPPCPYPIVPGLDSVQGNGAGDPVAYRPNRRTGGAAVLSLVGGAP